MKIRNIFFSEKYFYLIEGLKFANYNLLLLIATFTLNLVFKTDHYNGVIETSTKANYLTRNHEDSSRKCDTCLQEEKNNVTNQNLELLNQDFEHQIEQRKDSNIEYEKNNEQKENINREYKKEDNPTENSKEFKYENGDIFFGEHNNGNRNGYGVLRKSNNFIYEGNWKDNILINGYIYKGDFVGNGFAKVLYKNGDVCEGMFLNYKREGKQDCGFHDNSRYSGNYQADKKNGYGVMDFSDNRNYAGYWSNDEIFGQGRMEFPNGEWQEGEWKNNKMDGNGTYQYSNGAKFTGSWERGLKDGNGVLHLPDISTKFLGTWSNDRGQGTFYMKYDKTCLATEFNGNIECNKEPVSKPSESN